MPVLLTAQQNISISLFNKQFIYNYFQKQNSWFCSQIYTFLSLLYFSKWSHNLLSRSKAKTVPSLTVLLPPTSQPILKSHRLYFQNMPESSLSTTTHHLQNNRFLVGHRSSCFYSCPNKIPLHRAAKIEIRSFHSLTFSDPV